MKPAVFLDRDGTLIEDVGYLATPDGVRVIPGVPDALRRLAGAGFALVVVSNQSGVGRGLFPLEAVAAVNAEVARRFAAAGVTIDAWHCCPHLPDAGCACRKPGTQLHREAAAALDLDLGASWCIGDRPGDVDAARALAARAILVCTGEGRHHAEAVHAAGVPVAADLPAAVELVLGAETAQRPSQ